MTLVYALQFTREYVHREDTETHIGVYGAEAEAREAIEALKHKPGFADHPDGFEVVVSKLGVTGWADGFSTKTGPLPKDADGEIFDIPAWL